MAQGRAIDSDLITERTLLFSKKQALWLLIPVILFGCTMPGSIRPLNDRIGLKVTLTLNKQSFLAGEPIYTTVVLENTGTDSVTCVPRYENPVVLKDSHGRVYDFHGPRPMLASEPPAIKPGETLEKAGWELVSAYGVLPRLRGPYSRMLLRGSLPSGIYTARAAYLILRPYAANRQIVRSGAVGFVVAEPLGEEGRAHGLLEKGLECTCREKWEEAFSAFETLVERYPASVYAVLALEQAIGTREIPLGDRRGAHQMRKKLIMDYPDSPEALHHVRAIPIYHVNEKIYDEQLVREELMGIAEQTKGTQIEKEVEKILMEFDAGTSLFHKYLLKKTKQDQ